MHPLERLINLVALLLDTNRPLTFDEIRKALGAYQQTDRESAKRQFERDKDLLRGVGIPVEIAPTDPWEVDEGYRIPRERYELPDISFSPEEAAALFIAAHGDSQDGDAPEAFRKLLPGADKGLLSSLSDEGVTVDASGPHLQQIAASVAERKRIRFRYRPSEGEEARREVDPWGLVFRRGAWYVVGGDRDRGEPRSFKLSRIVGKVSDAGQAEPAPAEFRAADHLTAGPWGVGEPERTARVAFSSKVASWALSGLPEARAEAPRQDGWFEASVPAGAEEPFVSWILSFGPDAEVLEPADLRQAVVKALEEIRDAV
ncbi:MAG: helix-turn-helix transcriptional regulator [Actinomycetota bacterium]